VLPATSLNEPEFLGSFFQKRTASFFLHTGWRSGGTWLWSRLRDQSGVTAYYEPLHEVLATLDARQIARERPDAWASRHGGSAPYFAEYAPLLTRRWFRAPRGVRLHEPRFAYDQYFQAPEAADDALVGYIGGLLQAAGERVPVLKFCRSLGRVAWMQRHFPDALHAVVLRDPVAQFRSAEAQFAAGNRFFAVAPLMVLARNRQAPQVRDAVERFALRLPALPERRRDLDAELCWRHGQRLDEAGRYRIFLAFWTITAISALSAGAMLIDADRLGTDAAHRAAVARALRGHTGLDVGLETNVRPSPARSPAGAPATHDVALAMLEACRSFLPPDACASIAGKLAELTGVAPALDAPPAAWRDADARDAASRLRRAAYFAAMGASMPLRQLHGRVRG